ncbi:hypothetical protein [Actinopolymorpha rutila]|uniref:DUF4352 domain-containing protein n=1 Tax=Actinopolymorpha rutila TaxID=446787 RepID=A0A852ZKS9_9ACTN|nr:hypothetical protein [Actinopolymorpha rutila]NYH92823.1 hypothetical protein [Actinopolymorpha rutila]
MNRTKSIALSAVALALLAGCVATPPVKQVAERGGVRAMATSRSPIPTETPTPTPTAPDEYAWGARTVYADGIEMTVFKPTIMKDAGDGESWAETAEYDDEIKAALKAGDLPIKFTIQVRNTSSETFDPSMTDMNVLAGEDQLDPSCIDSDCGISLTKLRPGRSVRTTYAYFIPKTQAANVTAEVAPDFEHDPALYVGSVATH